MEETKLTDEQIDTIAKNVVDKLTVMAHQPGGLIDADNSYADKFITFRDEADEWRWKRVAINGQIVATSGEGYKSFSHCFKMMARQCKGGNPENITVED